MFSKMAEAERREGGDRVPGFLRTHPHSADRCVGADRRGWPRRAAGLQRVLAGVRRRAARPATAPAGPTACLPNRLLTRRLPSSHATPPPLPAARSVRAITEMLPEAEALREMSGCEAAGGDLQAALRRVASGVDWGA